MELTAGFLLLLSVPFVLAQNYCPATDDIFPCGCVSDGTNVRLDCIGVSSISDVRRAVLTLKDLKHVAVDFIMAKFDEIIPADLFDGVNVRYLSFNNCKLKGFADGSQPALIGLENTLEDLTVSFSYSEETGMNFVNLSNLQALEQLQIEGNHISTFTDEWFSDGPEKLNHLYVMTNFIKELGKHAFANLPNLTTLWLTNNEFSSLERSMFPRPAVHLTSLDLSNNKIFHLPNDIFSHMPSLREVILDENQIQVLPASTWSRVWTQLSRLYLLDNPLVCDSAIEWMFKLRRPNLLKGTCQAPAMEKGKQLKEIIDDKYEPDSSSLLQDRKMTTLKVDLPLYLICKPWWRYCRIRVTSCSYLLLKLRYSLAFIFACLNPNVYLESELLFGVI